MISFELEALDGHELAHSNRLRLTVESNRPDIERVYKVVDEILQEEASDMEEVAREFNRYRR